MRTIIVLSVLVTASGLCQMASAEEVTLKRSCLKDHPLAVGVNDPQLINIYSQLCDKKNKDNKNAYLVQAAQRFQQLGLNYRAIQIVNGLEQQNVQSPTLTDTKFLIGVKIADDALVQMREKESRSLSSDLTYPAVKFFTADIQKSLPSAAAKSPATLPAKPQVAARTTHTAKPRPKQVTRQKPLVSKAPITAPSQINSSTANPFGSLLKTP